MTRINCGIHPSELPDKLLLTEHREITRIPNAITSGKAKIKDIPKVFSLNTGHVKFFYDKQFYLFKRYLVLFSYCIGRGFEVQDKQDCWEGIPKSLWNDYKPRKQDREIILNRIVNEKGFKLR